VERCFGTAKTWDGRTDREVRRAAQGSRRPGGAVPEGYTP
jgi:hypothetical protein